MGVFGTGLYSGDFAMDLRSSIKAIARLPLNPAELLSILRSVEPEAAENSDDEDYTTFWLIATDQFAKRGLDCAYAREKALDIIDRGKDLAMLAELGMEPSDLEKRKQVLSGLRKSLLAPIASKRRPTLKRPQPYLMDVGDVLIYPTCGGDNINPYASRKNFLGRWQPDGWGAIVIMDRGRAFDLLAWYRPLAMVYAMAERPTIESLRGDFLWRLASPGTCSGVHFKRIEFETIGSFSIDERRLLQEFPKMGSGVYQAINDISIANSLDTAPRLNLKFVAIPGAAPDNYPGLRFPAI